MAASARIFRHVKGKFFYVYTIILHNLCGQKKKKSEERSDCIRGKWISRGVPLVFDCAKIKNYFQCQSPKLSVISYNQCPYYFICNLTHTHTHTFNANAKVYFLNVIYMNLRTYAHCMLCSRINICARFIFG